MNARRGLCLLLVEVVVGAAACSGGGHTPTAGPTTTTTKPPATTTPTTVVHHPALWVEVTLASRTLVSGSTMAARVIVHNGTGRAIPVGYCGSPFQVVLGNSDVHQDAAWTLCLVASHFPVGTSTWPVRVAGSYLSCGPASPRLPSDHEPVCRPGGGTPPLPPGRYVARVVTTARGLPTPKPIPVLVTPHPGA